MPGWDGNLATRWRWPRNLRRGSRIILIWHWLWLAWMLLRSGGPRSSAISNVSVLAQSWRVRWRLRLWPIAVECWSWLIARVRIGRLRRTLGLSNLRRALERVLLWLRLLWWRSQARATLTLVCHDATEETSLSVTQGRRRLRRATVLRRTTNV